MVSSLTAAPGQDGRNQVPIHLGDPDEEYPLSDEQKQTVKLIEAQQAVAQKNKIAAIRLRLFANVYRYELDLK